MEVKHRFIHQVAKVVIDNFAETIEIGDVYPYIDQQDYSRLCKYVTLWRERKITTKSSFWWFKFAPRTKKEYYKIADIRQNIEDQPSGSPVHYDQSSGWRIRLYGEHNADVVNKIMSIHAENNNLTPGEMRNRNNNTLCTVEGEEVLYKIIDQ